MMNINKLILLLAILLNIPASAQKPSFKFLRTGEVRPEGWLRIQMQNDIANGYARYLLRLTDRCHIDVFDVAHADSMRIGSGGQRGHIWWDGETTGNWLDGFIRISYLSDNKKAMKEADELVQTVLKFQEDDGYLGTYPKKIRYESPLGKINENNGELWSQACLYRGLIAYYELTGKNEVLEAVEKAAGLTISMYNNTRPYWSVAAGESGPGHNMMFADVCEQLYRITGKQKYLDFIRFLYDSWNELGSKTNAKADQLLNNLANPDLLLKMHGAHVMEHIRVPYSLYYFGDKKYDIAYKNWFKKVEKHLSPGGACISDEAIGGRPGSPDIGCEYCTMFELQYSLQSALEKTGISKYGDMIEKLAFNPAQGARLKNGMAIQYLTKDNQKEATSALGFRDKFRLSPTHEQAAVCCVPNSIRFYPYYLSNMWMRTADGNGIVAATYGPSVLITTIKGKKIEIVEHTNYPFEETINFTIKSDKKMKFPILLREPGWSVNTRIEAGDAKIERNDGFIRITKVWTKGDKISVSFDAEVIKNKDFQEEIYFSRGPLVYSLGFEKEVIPKKSYPVKGFSDMEAIPKSGQSMNYSFIKGSDFSFKSNKCDTEYPWNKCKIKLEGKLFNDDKYIEEKVSLTPLGTTLLRQTTFPVN